MMKGDYTDALNWAARAIRVNPNFGAAHWTMIAATAQLGNHDEALRCLMRFGAVQPGVTVAAIRAGQPTRRSRMDSTLDGLAKTGLAER
jgi:tetratricopeptide (TPR) repeat protein